VSTGTEASAYALLADGTTIEIRPARPEDFDAVRDMHTKMSPDNFYLRFFSMSPRAAEQEARRICREPSPDHAALLTVLDGEVVGCGALHLYGMHLAEVRSITIGKKAKGRGAGRLLIDALLAEAARQSVTCVCLFTRIPDFFGKMGFTVVDKELLPDKMYKDCLRCPRLHACDEIAMYMGELPEKTVLTTSPHAARYYTQLVQLQS